jgi:antitoxin component YwqK of YwqJK toxin-antitoxin module
MDTQERFQKNVNRWGAFCPNTAMLLSAFSNIENSSPKGLSREEAEAWAKGLDYSTFQVLYVYGLQTHAPYSVLKKWLSETHHFLVILESDLEAIAQFFKTEDAEEVLHNENIWLFYLDPQQLILDEIAKFFAAFPFAISALYLDESKEATFGEIRSKLAFFHNLYGTVILESGHHGLTFLANYFHNLFTWPTASLGNGLFNQFQDVPAIICGAGPSLEKNIHLLKTLKDRALIFGGGTSMNALNAAGMNPHLGVGIDPNQEQLTRIIMNDAFEVPFIYRGRMYREALKLIRSDKLYITGSSGYNIAEYFEKAFGIASEDIEEGCNVINFSLSIAKAMGCNPIFLVGVDLAYSENKSYAPGMATHPIHKHFRSKDEKDELIYREDIYGNVVPTLWKWITESIWFSAFAAQNPQINLINCTEGGLGFSGVPNMPLAEAAEKYLKQQQGIETRLLGEIQKSRMPTSITTERLIELLTDLKDSTSRALKAFEDHIQELMEMQNDEPNDSFSLAEFREHLRTLLKSKCEGEISYKYLLKGFDTAFDFMKLRTYSRLFFDKDLHSTKELQHQLIHLELERMHFLHQTATVNSCLMQSVLEDQSTIEPELPLKITEDKDPIESKNRNVQGLECCYRFENHQLTLIDPESDLNTSEKFIPDPTSGIMRLYDAAGALKFESHLKENKLHGPTRFYHSNGQILSESWYLEGLEEGKALTYTLTGTLNSIQRYKHGLKYGKQEYFFKDQSPRAILNYSEEGLLDGDLELFFRHGSLARKLSFINGKRHGMEQIWALQGQLAMEAHFNQGLPTGSAKIWYPNGQLAQESVYDDSAKVANISTWDAEGRPINTNASAQMDYFQDVAKSSKDLTENLKTLFKEITTLAPLLNQLRNNSKEDLESNRSGKSLQGLAQDLSFIGDAIGELQKMNTDLLFEAGLEKKEQGEDFWKTASLQHEVEKKLGDATAMMQGQLNVLRETLAKTIEAIKNKLASKDK